MRQWTACSYIGENRRGVVQREGLPVYNVVAIDHAREKMNHVLEQLRRVVRAGRNAMSKTVTVGLSLAMGLAIGVAGGSRLINPPAEAQTATTPASFSAVPGAIGAEDISGPYEVQEGWPKDLSTLPGHEKWTYGGARGIFAESPNRVFLLGGAELPAMRRPPAKMYPDVGPSVQFPVPGMA